MSPRQPIKPIWTKVELNMEYYSINISVKKNHISPMTWQKLSISSFPIISLWELKVAIATRVLIHHWNKKHIYSFPLPINAIYEI